MTSDTGALHRTARRARQRAAVLSLCGVALSACGPSGPTDATDAANAAASWTQAAVPARATSTGERVVVSAALGATAAGLPRLLAGVESQDGSVDAARVWAVDPDGHGWAWTDLPVAGHGDEAVALAVADGSTTWVAGTSTVPGRVRQPFLASSTDRERWADEALRREAATRAFAPQAAAAGPGSLLLLGSTGDFAPAVVSTGRDGALTELPAPPSGYEFRGFTGAAEQGATVVAVGTAAPAGGPDESVVYRSTDAGRTWQVALAPGQGQSRVSGVVAVTGGFVATGSTTDASSVAHPAAWASPDGSSWTAEALPQPGDDAEYAASTNEDGWLSGPATAGDGVVAAYGLDSDLRTAAVRRDAGGAWSLLPATPAWKAPGILPVVAGDATGSFSLVRSDANAVHVDLADASGRTQPTSIDLGTFDSGTAWTFSDPESGTGLVGYHRNITTTSDGGWTQSYQLTPYATDASGDVVDSTWQPAGSADLTNLHTASAPGGGTVVLGGQLLTLADGSQAVNVGGWARPSADAAWQPVEGLATDRSEEVADVTASGGGWVAAGTSRSGFSMTTRTSAAVWTSTDGVRWAKAPGPFDAPADGYGAASDTCALPGGDALVVGSETSGGVQRPAAWRLRSGTWERVDGAALTAGAGELDTCTSAGDRVLVQGTADGAPTLWTSADGATFTAGALGGRGDSFRAVRPVPGGYAAAGTHAVGGRAGAVVWLSTDARTWVPVAVPTTHLMDAADVAPVGERLAVALWSSTSPELWYLDDPERVLKG